MGMVEIGKRLTREHAYEYDVVEAEPKLVVQPGETFVVETEDALNGVITSEEQLPTREVLGADRWRRNDFNPCAGPIAVVGAKPGDLLAVHVHDIVVADQGLTCLFEGYGPLADSARFPDCRGPYTRIVRHLAGPSGTTSDGTGIFDERTVWPLAPHIGTIATAPERPIASGSDTAFGQGPFGGNIDCRDIRRGSTVLLPVAVEGAQLYLGDVHASMADGELYGMADESRADLTLSCEIIPDKEIPWLRVETPDAIVQLNSFRPLEDAVQQAFTWLLEWLVDDYGFSARDAYLQLGINPEVRINVYQMTVMGRLGYTVGVAFPKRYLL
jgi:acetamidase/formamidase